MKILLVGEYSRLHNSLKEGLEVLGNEVTLISDGDYFKDYPSDIKLKRRFHKGFSKKINVLLYKFFGIKIISLDLYLQFFRYSDQLKGFDLVQLINERPFGIYGKRGLEIINFLKNSNRKIHLLACGTDYINVKFAYEKGYKYSFFTPYFNKKVTRKELSNLFNYLEPESRQYHKALIDQVSGITASDMDYVLPYSSHPKYKGLIPNPINVDKIPYIENPIQDNIIIFHGINRSNFYKKGNDIFEKALNIIVKKYVNVEVIITENLPYKKYIHCYDKAHILMDQIYAYDQGYNALEAMAKGKVVFTGAEKEFLEYYNLQEDEVCINALPDVDYLVGKLSLLIENPDLIEKISRNSRAFIEREHHYLKIAQRYVDMYQSQEIFETY